MLKVPPAPGDVNRPSFILFAFLIQDIFDQQDVAKD